MIVKVCSIFTAIVLVKDTGLILMLKVVLVSEAGMVWVFFLVSHHAFHKLLIRFESWACGVRLRNRFEFFIRIIIARRCQPRRLDLLCPSFRRCFELLSEHLDSSGIFWNCDHIIVAFWQKIVIRFLTIFLGGCIGWIIMSVFGDFSITLPWWASFSKICGFAASGKHFSRWYGWIFLGIGTRHDTAIEPSLSFEFSHERFLYNIISFIEVRSDAAHRHHPGAFPALAARPYGRARSFEVCWGRLHAPLGTVELFHEVLVSAELGGRLRSLLTIRWILRWYRRSVVILLLDHHMIVLMLMLLHWHNRLAMLIPNWGLQKWAFGQISKRRKVMHLNFLLLVKKIVSKIVSFWSLRHSNQKFYLPKATTMLRIMYYYLTFVASANYW